MKKNADWIKDWLRWRGAIYRFIAQFYLEGPTDAFLDNTREANLMSVLAEDLSKEEFLRGCRLIAQDLTRSQEPEYKRALREDFKRLFVGPGHLEAPLWESVYRTEEKILFGEPTMAVRRFYQSSGAAIAKQNNEPEDHIGIELNFMARLCEEAIKFENLDEMIEGLDCQKRFLQEHLWQWVPAFCRVVLGAANTDMLRGLSIITREWVQHEAGELAAMLQTIQESEFRDSESS
ncbi:molecular chaperone [Acetonema longum]|uniref:Cytoplasmic chaperone TorD n=1 Tax=Acetonema longum DSM 6540 TaxID=1009370 RepID=F7NJR5_9FIRM|nr:molecular chaperone TorD family protein [Acetonema longum]EGO63721.1 cytoplasmic chaperone TorD [Acetonema longum DSM 6540]